MNVGNTSSRRDINSRNSSHSRNAWEQTTTAVRTHQNQARHDSSIRDNWNIKGYDNSGDARTGGKNINRMDVNHNRDTSNSVDANNSRDRTLETQVAAWTSTAVGMAATAET
jgi:hypothetical protein